MYILDTSVYVSALLKDDTMHDQWIDNLSSISDKIIINHLILSEVSTVLTYKHSKQLAVKFVEFIENDSRFVFVDDIVNDLIDFWKIIDNKISYVDASVIYSAIKYDLKLITFDKQMLWLYKDILRWKK